MSRTAFAFAQTGLRSCCCKKSQITRASSQRSGTTSPLGWRLGEVNHFGSVGQPHSWNKHAQLFDNGWPVVRFVGVGPGADASSETAHSDRSRPRVKVTGTWSRLRKIYKHGTNDGSKVWFAQGEGGGSQSTALCGPPIEFQSQESLTWTAQTPWQWVATSAKVWNNVCGFWNLYAELSLVLSKQEDGAPSLCGSVPTSEQHLMMNTWSLSLECWVVHAGLRWLGIIWHLSNCSRTGNTLLIAANYAQNSFCPAKQPQPHDNATRWNVGLQPRSRLRTIGPNKHKHIQFACAFWNENKYANIFFKWRERFIHFPSNSHAVSFLLAFKFDVHMIWLQQQVSQAMLLAHSS